MVWRRPRQITLTKLLRTETARGLPVVTSRRKSGSSGSRLRMSRLQREGKRGGEAFQSCEEGEQKSKPTGEAAVPWLGGLECFLCTHESVGALCSVSTGCSTPFCLPGNSWIRSWYLKGCQGKLLLVPPSPRP